MLTCPLCSAVADDGASTCPSCGAALTGTQATVRRPSPNNKTPKSSQKTSGSRVEGKFLAGTILNDRYRITGLIGRGGMGEVYKAEDLKLNQTVALKFLPNHFAMDEAAQQRFFNEVRTARQVSHPNVCRVFDIGEVADAHFLSMEFIDGDDLSSLLRRIGRLPSDKALEIARQLCAGLHAVHEAGILHRDFKPANVIIDGRGKARLTDFGIAGLESELKESVIAGTPAYMSPEQITGKELTKSSDVYSLGLVLYEIFTGKQVFASNSFDELLRKHKTATPTTPSNLIKDIDPLVDQVIMRCLEKDPRRRPASALQVSLALPGGDPLQAALAMGETPSPEMVAAAGKKTGLRPMVAVACLIGALFSLTALAFANRRANVIERIPFENSPEVLAAKGREMIAQLGYPERAVDSAYGLAYDTDGVTYINQQVSTDRRRQLENSGAVYFWYRESPNHLRVLLFDGRNYQWTVTEDDPLPISPGMRGVKLNTLGRLEEFYVRLPAIEEVASAEQSDPTPTAIVPDWTKLFTLAGLESSRFTSTQPLWNPDSMFDARAAWTGTTAKLPDVPLRVEAAAYKGKVVFFKLIAPWTRPDSLQTADTRPVIIILIPVVLVVGALALAWRNYRAGKGDYQGALKLLVFAGSATVLFWLLTASHVPTTDELKVLAMAVSFWLYYSVVGLGFYIALEPYVRRRWPTSLITWSRVLAGKFTDPLVGRDVFIGIILGMWVALAFKLSNLAAIRPNFEVELYQLLGVRFVISRLLVAPLSALLFIFALTFLITLLRAWLRRDWLAAVVAILILALGSLTSSSRSLGVAGLIASSLIVLTFMRFGLLALFAALVVNDWLLSLPLTTNFSTWYAGTSLFGMIVVIVLAVYVFYISLGGQKVFTRNPLGE